MNVEQSMLYTKMFNYVCSMVCETCGLFCELGVQDGCLVLSVSQNYFVKPRFLFTMTPVRLTEYYCHVDVDDICYLFAAYMPSISPAMYEPQSQPYSKLKSDTIKQDSSKMSRGTATPQKQSRAIKGSPGYR